MTKKTVLATTLMLLFVALNSNAQTKTTTKKATIEVIQFHATNRCMTCNKIETLTREALKNFPDVTFKLVNVDDTKNEKFAAEFEASGTALFIYNPKTKKKKDLTDFAFMNARSKPEEFKAGVAKEIEAFK